MTKDKVLGSCILNGVSVKLVHLHGNHKPYFSVEDWSKHPDTFPGNMHLSDEDGIPMHALENAKYHAGLCSEVKFTSEWHHREHIKKYIHTNMPHVTAYRLSRALEELGLEKITEKTVVKIKGSQNANALARHLRISDYMASSIVDKVNRGIFEESDMARLVCSLTKDNWMPEAKRLKDAMVESAKMIEEGLYHNYVGSMRVGSTYTTKHCREVVILDYDSVSKIYFAKSKLTSITAFPQGGRFNWLAVEIDPFGVVRHGTFELDKIHMPA